MIVPSARERFYQRKARRFARVVTAVLLSFVVLIRDQVAGYAEPSGSSLTIDYDKLPIIAVDAKDVSLVQILNQLADGLHFQVENPPSVEKSPTISGSFKGDIADLLRRVLLRGMNYITLYRGAAIKRIVITPSEGTAIVATAPSSPGEENDMLSGGSAPATEAIAAAAMSSHAARTEPTRGPLEKLLQSQVSAMQKTVADIGSAASSDAVAPSAASPRSTSQRSPSAAGATQASLAVATRVAQQNVRMLVEALRSVCIGGSCGR